MLCMFGSEREEDLARDIFATIELALAKGQSGVVLLLDEAQLVRDERDRHGEHPLSLLFAPVVALQHRELPLGLVVCGLPTLAGNLQKARSYSERLFGGEEIGSLEPEQALEAFTRPLEQSGRKTDRGVAKSVVEEVEGYPYFLAAMGIGAVGRRRSRRRRPLHARPARRDAARYLRTARPGLLRTTSRDVDPGRAGPADGVRRLPVPPLRSADLTKASDKTPGNVNVLLGRLVEAGALYRMRKGEYAYTAPKFRDYLSRRAAA